MSTFYFDENNRMMSFEQWCLSESIVDTPTEFGTNKEKNNGEIKSEFGNHYTFFTHKGSHHVVVIQPPDANGEHEVGMGTSKDHSLHIMHYSDARQPHGSPIGAFGKTMHIIHHIADKHNIKKLKFHGADPRLGSMYERLMGNKHFIKSMADKGWRHSVTTVSRKRNHSDIVDHAKVFHFERD